MHVISLSILVKCIEEYSYAESQKLIALLKCGITEEDQVYKKLVNEHEQTLELFKKRSIAIILALHPDYFKPTIEFDDWDTAMRYLSDNKKIAQTFLS